MINVELHDSEAFGKLAEYESRLFHSKNEGLIQCLNTLKISIIKEIGEINYYEIVASEEYQRLLSVMKSKTDMMIEGRFCKGKYKQFLTNEYKAKLKFQRRWFGRGAWAVKFI
jgi:hypothetical protein